MAKYDIIEITQDFYPHGTYTPDAFYSSVPGMPEYVPYHKLRNALMKHLRAWIPDLPELQFRDAGNKAYAYVRPAA